MLKPVLTTSLRRTATNPPSMLSKAHPAGIHTIHFWAPAWKWMLVFATVGDYFRPANKLSIKQSASLTATDLIWSRYSMVIIPVNYTLLSVNAALGTTGAFQIFRILSYRHENNLPLFE